MTENMAYYTERLQCSDEEKDACLETVAKLYQLREEVCEHGLFVVELLAKREPDPFFRACLMDLADFWDNPDGLERLLDRYLTAGDYWGGAFLNAVLICRGIVMLARGFKDDGNYFGDTDPGSIRRDWYDSLGEGLRGYFGVKYREIVLETIEQAARTHQPKWECPSLMPEFDDLLQLSSQQRDWLVRNVSSRHLCCALKLAGSAVSEFLMAGAEDREKLERDLYFTNKVHRVSVLAAQRTILLKAEEAKVCM